jgi:hypothetical protein
MNALATPFDLPPTRERSTPFGTSLAEGHFDTLLAYDGAEPLMPPPAGCSLARTAPLANHPSSPHRPTQAEQYDALNFPLLAMAESLNDVEQLRIATGHRLRQLAERGGVPGGNAVCPDGIPAPRGAENHRRRWRADAGQRRDPAAETGCPDHAGKSQEMTSPSA